MSNTILTQAVFVTLSEANKVQSIAAGLGDKILFHKMWIYPSSVNPALNGGKLALNVGTVYVGEKTEGGNATPDALANGGTIDGIVPLKIELPDGRNKLVRDVLIQGGNVGDGVWCKYWPA